MMKEALGNKERDLIDATQRFLEDEKSDSHSQIRSETPTHDSNLSFLIHRTYLTFQNVKLTDNLEK
jgi:hypothetical protein